MYETYDIVETDGPPFEQNLPGPARVDSEPQFDNVETDVLVEWVQNQFAHSAVIPRAVDKQQTFQKAKLRDGIIGGAGRLKTFHARDTCGRGKKNRKNTTRLLAIDIRRNLVRAR